MSFYVAFIEKQELKNHQKVHEKKKVKQTNSKAKNKKEKLTELKNMEVVDEQEVA